MTFYVPDTNYEYKYPHSNDNSQYADDCQSDSVSSRQYQSAVKN